MMSLSLMVREDGRRMKRRVRRPTACDAYHNLRGEGSGTKMRVELSLFAAPLLILIVDLLRPAPWLHLESGFFIAREDERGD
jgi:hypothetical protein